jgi:hypothetical protein
MIQWCGRPDSNRHRSFLPRDFKSLASTISPRPRAEADLYNTSAERPRITRSAAGLLTSAAASSQPVLVAGRYKPASLIGGWKASPVSQGK